MKRFGALLGLATAVVLATCGDPAGPTAGWLRVTLSGPGTDHAGLLLTVSGGPIDSVRTGFPTLYFSRSGEEAMRVIVGGAGVSGLVLEISVPDVGAISDYRAQLEQIAGPVGTFAQRDPTLYRLEVTRQ
jgi:hypothetical protein